MTEQPQTEFNSNVASLIRVDDLIKKANYAQITGDYINYFQFLSALMKEALYKMVNNKGEPDENRIKCLEKYSALKSSYEIYKRHPNQMKVKMSFFNNLEEFDIFLRDFMGRRGMLLTDEKGYNDEPISWGTWFGAEDDKDNGNAK